MTDILKYHYLSSLSSMVTSLAQRHKYRNMKIMKNEKINKKEGTGIENDARVKFARTLNNILCGLRNKEQGSVKKFKKELNDS